MPLPSSPGFIGASPGADGMVGPGELVPSDSVSARAGSAIAPMIPLNSSADNFLFMLFMSDLDFSVSDTVSESPSAEEVREKLSRRSGRTDQAQVVVQVQHMRQGIFSMIQSAVRSEERRVGKECRGRWGVAHQRERG